MKCSTIQYRSNGNKLAYNSSINSHGMNGSLFHPSITVFVATNCLHLHWQLESSNSSGDSIIPWKYCLKNSPCNKLLNISKQLSNYVELNNSKMEINIQERGADLSYLKIKYNSCYYRIYNTFVIIVRYFR